MEQLSPYRAHWSDMEIINKISGGEPALFEVLIRRYNSVLYKIARSYGFNHQDTEDLMQETHVAAYQHLAQFAGRAAYKTWISKIMIHKCLYRINHGHAKKELPAGDLLAASDHLKLNKDNAPTPEQASIGKEFTIVLEHALQRIPVIYRTVFAFRELEGFSVAETAELLGISAVNVKVRLNRARTMLQKELEQFYPSTNLYEFNLVYCDGIVDRVFAAIRLLHP